MKKISLIFASVFMAAGSYAQGIGVLGGVTLNNQRDHYHGETVSNQLKTGYFGEVVFDIGLGKHWSVQPGIAYMLKGGQQERHLAYVANDNLHEVKLKNKNSLHYIEVPLNLVYKMGSCNQFFIGAGGYAATLVSAYSDSKMTDKVDGQDMGETKERNHIRVGEKTGDDLSRFDFGLTGIIGYEFSNGIFLRGGVDAGLYDIIRNDNVTSYQSTLPPTVSNTDATSKNISYNFGIGYMFR